MTPAWSVEESNKIVILLPSLLNFADKTTGIGGACCFVITTNVLTPPANTISKPEVLLTLTNTVIVPAVCVLAAAMEVDIIWVFRNTTTGGDNAKTAPFVVNTLVDTVNGPATMESAMRVMVLILSCFWYTKLTPIFTVIKLQQEVVKTIFVAITSFKSMDAP